TRGGRAGQGHGPYAQDVGAGRRAGGRHGAGGPAGQLGGRLRRQARGFAQVGPWNGNGRNRRQAARGGLARLENPVGAVVAGTEVVQEVGERVARGEIQRGHRLAGRELGKVVFAVG